MKIFTAKEAKNKLGEVLRTALQTPVVISVHGKPSVRVTSVLDEPAPAPPRNDHDDLDRIKHLISCEVLATFPLAEIKKRSLANIKRWRAAGTSGPAYDSWIDIISDPDDTRMIAAMVGLNDRSNQLRQSMPYVGMLDKRIVRKLNEEVTA